MFLLSKPISKSETIIIEGRSDDLNLQIMGGRNPLKEDLGFGRINILINPPSPCVETLIKCCQSVHIFIQTGPLSDIIPPANNQKPSDQHSPSESEHNIKYDAKILRKAILLVLINKNEIDL